MVDLKPVVVAAENLLNYIKTQYPDDFVPGGKGFSSSLHADLDKALKEGDERKVLAASRNLLASVKAQHPKDFVPGGKGFTCPYHRSLDNAVEIAMFMSEPSSPYSSSRNGLGATALIVPFVR